MQCTGNRAAINNEQASSGMRELEKGQMRRRMLRRTSAESRGKMEWASRTWEIIRAIRKEKTIPAFNQLGLSYIRHPFVSSTDSLLDTFFST